LDFQARIFKPENPQAMELPSHGFQTIRSFIRHQDLSIPGLKLLWSRVQVGRKPGFVILNTGLANESQKITFFLDPRADLIQKKISYSETFANLFPALHIPLYFYLSGIGPAGDQPNRP